MDESQQFNYKNVRVIIAIVGAILAAFVGGILFGLQIADEELAGLQKKVQAQTESLVELQDHSDK